MPRSKLIRLSHLALVFFGVVQFTFPLIQLNPALLSLLLLFIGWAGIHARQNRQTGWQGRIALAFILISFLLPSFIGIPTTSGRISNLDFSTLLKLLPIAVLQMAGYFWYGILTRKAKVLPFYAAALMLFYPFLLVVLSNWGMMICVTGIGAVLWNHPPVEAEIEQSPTPA